MGVPLGLALLAALGLLWRERRHRQHLRKQIDALNAARDPLAPSTGNIWENGHDQVPLASSTGQIRENGHDPNKYHRHVHQLDDGLTEELDGMQMNEMADRTYR